MTVRPLLGPSSTYEIFRTPASICFKFVNVLLSAPPAGVAELEAAKRRLGAKRPAPTETPVMARSSLRDMVLGFVSLMAFPSAFNVRMRLAKLGQSVVLRH